MKKLERTSVDIFSIENAITLEELENRKESAKFIEIEDIFADKEKIILDENKLKLFLNGVMLTYELPDGIYQIYNDNKFIGLGILKNRLLKRDVII